MAQDRFLDDVDEKKVAAFFRLLDDKDLDRLIAGVGDGPKVPENQRWWLSNELKAEKARRQAW